MRMRKRANLDARMERCAALLADDPAALRGQWLERFPGHEGIFLELGCGKGRFTAGLAAAVPNMLYLALEKVPDAMILAMERVKNAGLQNVRFLDADAKLLKTMFADGEVERLYINFCDPWPKSRDAKLRLTAPGFLRLYADALKDGGQIHFKTDNTPLFDWSIGVLEEEGWALGEVTHDLHGQGTVGVMTDYEAKFTAEGMKINRLVATKTAETRDSSAGELPRLRGASLADARGNKTESEIPLTLAPWTLPLCHAFYRDFVQAPELFEDAAAFQPYVYDPAQVDAWYAERAKAAELRKVCVLLDGNVIGEVEYKHVDEEKKRCELGICLVNDRWKNKGYGTAALRLAIRYAFEELGMETVLAESLLKNTRSQHVLQKAGFRYVSADGHFRYYRITREQYAGQLGEKRE